MIFHTPIFIISYLFASLAKMISGHISVLFCWFCLIMKVLTKILTSFSPFRVINYHICDYKHKKRGVVLSKKVPCFLLSRFLNFLIPWTNSLLVHLCDSQLDNVLVVLCYEALASLVPYTSGHSGWAVLVKELLGV